MMSSQRILYVLSSRFVMIYSTKNAANMDSMKFITAEGERRTGRVLGRASDVITIDGSGTLLVNGTAQAGEIMYPTYPEEGLGYPYTVPDGCVFILGDYRTQSQDSRDFGAIALDDVEAKVITVIRRRSL